MSGKMEIFSLINSAFAQFTKKARRNKIIPTSGQHKQRFQMNKLYKNK